MLPSNYIYWAVILTLVGMVERAYSDDILSSSLIIEKPRARETPAGASVGAGYLSILNTGTVEDCLVSVESDISESVEIHSIKIDDGIMRMRMVKGGLNIMPKTKVNLKPGGHHLMFIGLKAPLIAGEQFNVILNFKIAGKVEVLFNTESTRNIH
ncbi:MAG: hypothetical protein TECD_00144 [Hyphomicrobiaceae bacterium hypho_1]